MLQNEDAASLASHFIKMQFRALTSVVAAKRKTAIAFDIWKYKPLSSS